MPSEAFFNLDDEKRIRIIESIKNEFRENGFEKASVNKIVENAGISKGSFWFYFENKKEAVNYIIDTYIEKEKEEVIKLLIKNNGDIFETYIELYDFIKETEIEEFKCELLPYIFKDLIINNNKIIDNFSTHPKTLFRELIKDTDFNKIINLEEFREPTKQELISLVKMLNYILRNNIVDAIKNIESEENAKENYLRQIEILRKGVLK